MPTHAHHRIRQTASTIEFKKRTRLNSFGSQFWGESWGTASFDSEKKPPDADSFFQPMHEIR
jgi:hypothetical protein